MITTAREPLSQSDLAHRHGVEGARPMISMISMIDRLVKAGRRAVNEEHRRAARIQQQLEAQGMGAALLEHMVRHVLDLQQQRTAPPPTKHSLSLRRVHRPVPLQHADGGSGMGRRQEGHDHLGQRFALEWRIN